MRRLSMLAAAVVIAGFAVVGASPEWNRDAGMQAPAKKSTPTPSAAARKIMYPPIPNPGFAPGRPVDQTRAVYQFAAEHPEVLQYVPCYCGCESTGHPHNESCFVKRRDGAGNVVEWDTHGYG